MKIKVYVKTLADDVKQVLQVGEFKLGGTYVLTSGHHSGRLIRLTYISPNKQVIVAGQRQRQISGILQGDNIKINSVLTELQ